MLTIPTSVVPGDLPEKLRAVAAVGFDAIDLSLSDVAQFDGSLSELSTLIAAAGLTIASLGPLDADASLAQIEAKLVIAQELGVDLVILDVADTDAALPDPSVLGSIRLALRPTRAAEDAVCAWVAETAHPQIGLALNAFEVLGDGSPPARLRDLDGAGVFHVALWDGPQQPMLPGQGVLNLGGLARVLVRAGYHGPWSVGAAPQGPDTVLNAYRSLVTVLSDAAMTEPLLRAAVPALPKKVPAKGFEFIEFAVDAAGAAELEATLTAMAFRRERRHLSKKVTLWRQGAVNIVIN